MVTDISRQDSDQLNNALLDLYKMQVDTIAGRRYIDPKIHQMFLTEYPQFEHHLRSFNQEDVKQLSKIYEPISSENSYGFRDNRSCHDAILKAKEIMNNGYKWVADLDLEKFFDTVNKDLLISIIRRTVNEDKVISIIRKYLQAGVLVTGLFFTTKQILKQDRKREKAKVSQQKKWQKNF